MPDLAVRRAKSGDVSAIADLYTGVAEEMVAREPALRHVPTSDGVRRRYLSRIRDRQRAVLIAVADGSVIAFVDVTLQRHEDEATYHLPGVDAHVEELIVTSSHRCRGIASAPMRAAEALAKDAGVRTVLLDTYVTNVDARTFYRTLSYREAGVILLNEL